jgi:hypothetical protein
MDYMTQRTGLSLAMLFVVLALSACATAIQPGQLYQGSDWAGYLDVRSPNSEGWRMMADSPNRITFRKGTQPDQEFGAEVARGRLPPEQMLSDFMTHLEAALFDHKATIFKSAHAFTDERRYPCMRSMLHGSGAYEARIIMLSCRHPVRTDTAFSLFYFQRGHREYPNLESEAQAFFDGIQVPGH